MAFVSFQGADDIVSRFLTLLSNLDIHPPLGSALEDELLSLTELLEIIKNPSHAEEPKQVALLRTAAGLHDLAAKVLSVAPLSEFKTFVPHLRLIAEAKVRAASLTQNAASSASDDTARKMAELYMGCLAAHIGTEVVLDSPTNAKGDNPDVIFKIETSHLVRRPQLWTLAIKTISSQQGQTIFDRIEDGANQIDKPKCLAEKGMVVINAKSALDHDALWNASFSELSSAMAALAKQLKQLAASAAAGRPQGEWDALFMQKVVRPVLFLGQSLAHLPTPAGARTPTPLKMLLAYDANGVLDPVGHCLANMMNCFMQTILLGIPGGPGYDPH